MAQILKGKIVSNKMQSTAVVEVTRLKRHPVYGKQRKVSDRYKAHVSEVIPEGTIVEIKACRPRSGGKKWEVVKTS
ncbi:30S ribosomal protein S17 [Candidatus Giovannonibacteria bacterium RIFCSPHIGHO2_01_FULL_45_33]|uniref:30S ribosomal protein S17 n=1 Tax=Candidatus Giovannonibacteria bacterium RIFCSPLOWO2_01_FULL_45_34 TaxID=1798351 RepID=A0A1F5X074_9BACT|nr:MAG: 30S ribosomal protein S17 [Candidatus Giovannonibacteria bacterium RIFCSPHIGHO2_01_FULL_45_33]OGF69305.1 MAG: 30S ribosomal protein S17 [Candidatus Giovannonibacteria bacterium RIFCSPHIGHO2_02_FULL_44_11]OGF81279.1 MAG: 30S ribosomal protein S17 [Candidatus Giovannonibacteria bacterium RIFCSPLOWO2_01_FULL_45_34]